MVMLLAMAMAADFSVETRYASAFGPDAWGTARVRAEAAEDLEVGALLVGGTRAAVFASAGKRLHLHDRIHWRPELLVGMRRTSADAEGGPVAGFDNEWVITPVDTLDAVVGGGYVPGIGGWFEGGVDAHTTDRWTLHPRLRAGTWAGDRDLALRVELGLSHRWTSGWFVRAAAGAGGRDTVHLGPSAALTVGRRL